MNREYNYEDIYLIPQKCIVKSRSECDISIKLGKRRFKNPVIAANMKSVINAKTCEYLASKGMFYVMHRFDTDKYIDRDFIKLLAKDYFSSISIGIKEEDYDKINYFKEQNAIPDYVTIDIAHAHSDCVADMIKFLKNTIPDTFVIAGNVATGEAVEFLQEAGADCIKIFVGPGNACTTRLKTGFTRGTVTCLQECAAVSKVPLIADGGIRHCGDIAKAMALGATAVMAGSFMAGYNQNSGEIVKINGHKQYIYYGSASFNNKGTKEHVEGTEVLLDYKGNMDEHIYDIECSLRSSVSYAGIKKIENMYGTPIAFFK